MLGHQPSLKHYLYVIFSNIATLIAVVVGTIIVVALAQGYRYDLDSGQVSLTGLLRVQSAPVSASVFIDDQDTEEQTPFKRTFEDGTHTVTLRADGYRDWNKKLTISGGKVEYLAYPRLIPETITTEDLLARPLGNRFNFQPSGRYAMAAQAQALEIIDLNEAKIEVVSLAVPFIDETASLRSIHWSEDEAFALVEYTQGSDKIFVWVNVEDQTVENLSAVLSGFTIEQVNRRTIVATKTATDLWAIAIDDADVVPLSANREQFAVSDNYVVWKDKGDARVQLWDGEQTVTALELDIQKTALGALDVLEYDQKVNVVYQLSPSNELKTVVNVLGTQVVRNLKAATGYVSASPSDRFALLTTEDGYASYDYEKSQLNVFTTEAPLENLRWADDFRLFANQDGATVLLEFDGANQQTLLEQAANNIQIAASGRYLYFRTNNTDSKTSVLSRGLLIVEREN